jgi:hypothetical protein
MSEMDMVLQTETASANSAWRRRLAIGLTGAMGLGMVGGLAALNRGESSTEAAGATSELDACLDGAEDVGPFEVNNGFLNVPYKEGYLIEAVCVDTQDAGFRKIDFGGVADATVQVFPDIILGASVDYEVDPSYEEEPEEKVCEGLDSGKIDIDEDVNVAVLTIYAEPGQVITRYCVKAGSIKQGDGPEYVDVIPPASSVEISHSSEKDISHYSFEFEDKPDVTTTTAPGEVTTTTAPGEVTTTTAPGEVTTTTAPGEVTTTTAPGEVTTTTAPGEVTTTTGVTTTIGGPNTP